MCAANQDSCAAATRALSEQAAGSWTGYIENFGLSQDDGIKISISVASDGTLSGQVVFGKEAPPPPPTDPAKPWPEDFIPEKGVPVYIPGYVYTAENVRWEAQRLRFQAERYEPWQTWCSMQKSYLRDEYNPPIFTCSPYAGDLRVDANTCRQFGLASSPAARD